MIDKYKIVNKYIAPYGDPHTHIAEFGDAVSMYLSNNEICLYIAPVYQYWRLQIIIDGFFPCAMDKCRKICTLIYNAADDTEDAEQVFAILSDILSELLTAYQDAGCSLSYIKRMKRNIDYIERLAKDG